MRTVSTGARRGVALFPLLAVLAAPAAYPDESFPYEPPQARIHPPIGVTSQEPSLFELLLDWACLYARIHPPIG